MEHKARGAKHYFNKNQKYKPDKYKQGAKVTKQKVNPKQAAPLESNWHKYDSDEEEDHSQLTDSTNFALLADAAITSGSHFQFKSDKETDFLGDAEDFSNNADNLFKLNLEVLDKSLSTIPFTTRCGIEEKYFTENQLKTMHAIAASNLKSYNTAYASQLEKHRIKSRILEKHQTDSDLDELVNRVQEVLKEDADDDSDLEIDGSHEVPAHMEKAKVSSTNEDEDLEEWLDDLLAS